jgi:hypothetical protein
VNLASLPLYLEHELKAGRVATLARQIDEFTVALADLKAGARTLALLREVASRTLAHDASSAAALLPTLAAEITASALGMLEPGVLGRPQELYRTMRGPFSYAAVALTSPILGLAVATILRGHYGLQRSHAHPAFLAKDLVALNRVRVVADRPYCEVLLALGIRRPNLLHLGPYAVGERSLYADIGILTATNIHRLLDWGW